MWFKNLALFRLTEPFNLSQEELQEQLESLRFRECGRLELSTQGWISPLAYEDQILAHQSNGFTMLCTQKEEKLLPSSVINEQVAERCAEYEAKNGRKPGKNQRASIKDEVITTLLPRAFSHRKRTYGYLDPKGGWLIIDAASDKKADEFTSLLRKSLGTLAISPPVTEQRPTLVMTAWLSGQEAIPSDLTIENECELRAVDEDGSLVRCKRHDLFSEEIQSHLSAGKEVTKLAVSWDDRLNFVLDENGAVKRLRFLDVIQEQAADIETDNEQDRFDADFSIMSLELNQFLPRLLELLGGENTQSLAAPPQETGTS